VPRILSDADVTGFRERLCEAAARLFAERGRDGFNMRELAAQLGVSAMTPYRYFKDKDEIFAVVRARAFERFADQMAAALASAQAPVEKGQAAGDAYVHFALEEPASYRLMFDLTQPETEALPALTAATERARTMMIGQVRLMVDSGFYQGEPELIAHVIWAALHGAIGLYLTGKLTREEFTRVQAEALRALSRGFARTDA
jgi:AcrR family transcriptional regulator